MGLERLWISGSAGRRGTRANAGRLLALHIRRYATTATSRNKMIAPAPTSDAGPSGAADGSAATVLLSDAEDEELLLREEVAAAHWATHHFGMDDLVWNHISARCADGSVLITPGAMMWDEITPESLLKVRCPCCGCASQPTKCGSVCARPAELSSAAAAGLPAARRQDSENVTANVIHDAIYSRRPDAKAVVHLHTRAATAVSCLEGGFQCLDQNVRVSSSADACCYAATALNIIAD
jgi:hypothetical protein